MTKYDVDYFINKFEAIPYDQWCTSFTTNNEGQHCALGHCEGHDPRLKEHIGEAKEFNDLIRKHKGEPAWYINDNCGLYYKYGDNPKERVINVLKYIKNKQLL